MSIFSIKKSFAVMFFILPYAAMAENHAVMMQRVDDSAYQHLFNSTLIHHDGHRIIYSVCNGAQVPSGFFWRHAGFFMNEDAPQEPGHCVQRTFMAMSEANEPPETDTRKTDVEVGRERGRVDTIFWCNFFGFSRCGNNVFTGPITFVTTLDRFAGGPDREPELVIDAYVDVFEGKYEVTFNYDPLGRRMIIAVVGSNIETLEVSHSVSDDVQILPLGELVDTSDSQIYAGLNEGTASFEIEMDPAEPGEFFLSVIDSENADLAIVLLAVMENSASMRIDVVDRLDFMQGQ